VPIVCRSLSQADVEIDALTFVAGRQHVSQLKRVADAVDLAGDRICSHWRSRQHQNAEENACTVRRARPGDSQKSAGTAARVEKQFMAMTSKETCH
jgi:hypothetical protein